METPIFQAALRNWRTLEVNRGLHITLTKLLHTPPARGIDKDVLARFDPAATFNACTQSYNDRYVILLYNGFLNLTMFAATLLMDRIHLRVQEEIIYPLYPIDQSHRQYISAIEAICLKGEEVLAPRLAKRKHEHATALYAAVVEFALAHELAHIVNKDFDKITTAHGSEGRDFHAFRNDWEVEFTADEIAIALLRPIFDEKPFYLVYAGAVILFELADSVRRHLAHMAHEIPDDLVSHPPPRSRRAELFRRTLPDRYKNKASQQVDVAKMHERLEQYMRYFHEVAYEIPFDRPGGENAVVILRRYSEEYDHSWFYEMNPGDQTLNHIGFPAIRESVRRGHDYMRSLVSSAALLHLQIGEYRSGHKAQLLGILLTWYATEYDGDSRCAELLRTIRECVPTIDYIMEDIASNLGVSALYQASRPA